MAQADIPETLRDIKEVVMSGELREILREARQRNSTNNTNEGKAGKNCGRRYLLELKEREGDGSTSLFCGPKMAFEGPNLAAICEDAGCLMRQETPVKLRPGYAALLDSALFNGEAEIDPNDEHYKEKLDKLHEHFERVYAKRVIKTEKPATDLAKEESKEVLEIPQPEAQPTKVLVEELAA